MSLASYSDRTLPRFHFFFAGITAFISLVVILGWLFEVRSLVQVSVEAPPMVFNTALGLFIFSVSYILKRKTRYLLLRLSSLFIATLSILTICEYALGTSILGIDTLFNEPFFDSGLNPPGRMSLSTCVAFFIMSVMGLPRKKSFANQMVLVVCSSLLISFALLALIGYVFQFNSDFGWGSYSHMSMNSSAALIFLSCAFLWQVRTDTSYRDATPAVLYPFYVVMTGIFISMSIWQMLLIRDQDRGRRIILLKADSVVASVNGHLTPLQKALQRMANRFANESYPSRELWEKDAEAYIEEFDNIHRLIWSDKTNSIKWVYPNDDKAQPLLGRNVILPHRDIRKNTVEIYREFEDSMAMTYLLSGGETGFIFQTPSFRKEEFEGSVSAVVLANPFFDSFLSLPGYSIEVFRNGQRIYSNEEKIAFFAREWRVAAEYQSLGPSWQIVLTPTVDEIRKNTSALPAFVLIFSISISVMFGVLLRLYIRVRESERKIKEAFEWKRAGIDSASLLMISSDKKGQIVEVNAAALATLEYSQQELERIGSIYNLFDPEEVRQFHALVLIDRAATLQTSEEFLNAFFDLKLDRASEWTLISKSKKKHKVVLTTSRIYDAYGAVSGYLSIMEDVTQLREKELLLEEQGEQLQISTRLASLGEMAAGIAHEINNPLAVIGGHASILRRSLTQRGEPAESELIKKVDSIESMVQRIAKIIRGLKFYAREPDGAETEVVNFQALMDDTMSFCGERFKKEGVELNISIAPNLLLEVQPYKITQVLLNILNNALDAVSEQPVKQVSLTAKEEGEFIRIEISDTGSGVPAHLKKKIMEPFFTTKEVGKGLGLGLSISASIVNAHRGTLTIDDSANKTKFILQLPKSSKPSPHE